jgi:hypothetical protein
MVNEVKNKLVEQDKEKVNNEVGKLLEEKFEGRNYSIKIFDLNEFHLICGCVCGFLWRLQISFSVVSNGRLWLGIGDRLWLGIG